MRRLASCIQKQTIQISFFSLQCGWRMHRVPSVPNCNLQNFCWPWARFRTEIQTTTESWHTRDSYEGPVCSQSERLLSTPSKSSKPHWRQIWQFCYTWKMWLASSATRSIVILTSYVLFLKHLEKMRRFCLKKSSRCAKVCAYPVNTFSNICA